MRGATAQEELVAIINASTHVLIDFDGPICRVFSALSAEGVASKLLEILLINGISIPPKLQQATDPLEMLRFAGGAGGGLADQLHSMLSEAELEAVESATPTSGSRELIIACQQTERPVGIVSNNSEAAVQKYLRAHHLFEHVDHIAARIQSDPLLLKPDPHLIIRSIDALGGGTDSFVLLGDSVSDIEAARAARIRHIGYANKPGKLELLIEAGADAVIRSLVDLTNVVLAPTVIRPA